MSCILYNLYIALIIWMSHKLVTLNVDWFIIMCWHQVPNMSTEVIDFISIMLLARWHMRLCPYIILVPCVLQKWGELLTHLNTSYTHRKPHQTT